MSTIHDVARRAGVSTATVSRVVNNSNHKVNHATRERVLSAIKELDYRPNALAKGLLIKKTMTIGIIIPDISNTYYAEIVSGIQDTADQAEYAVLLQNTDRKRERILKYIYLCREKLVDGIIFSGGIIHGYEPLSALGELRDRVVVIGRHEIDFPAVRVDNVASATRVTEHLIASGHRRIGFISGPEMSTTMADRATGYMNALSRNGCSLDRSLLRRGRLTPESGYQAAMELLDRYDRPTAILAANDQMSFGAFKAVRERGMRVPDDIALAGFDDIPLSSYFCPPLTTVRIPAREMGAAAVEMLIDLISGNLSSKIRSERTRWFDTELLVRGSTYKG